MLNVDYAVRSVDTPSSSFSRSSLNSIDENRTIDEFNDFIFAKKLCADAYSNNYLSEKRQSEPAIRFSFYNKLFDIDGSRMQRLTSPPKDYRKYSLPLSMTSSLPCPISSLMSPTSSCQFAVDVPTWRSFHNAGKKKSAHKDAKFQLTINDEDGQEIPNSSFEVVSPMDDDENCLFYEECQNRFENNFIDDNDKARGENNREVCKKCGHLTLKL